MINNDCENHKCALRLKKRIQAILAVMNTTELVVEIKFEKQIQARTGFEPMTLSKCYLVNRATDTKLYFC